MGGSEPEQGGLTEEYVGYQPTSQLLVAILNEDALLVGSDFADHNLHQVIALVGDSDSANRDWAAFILGHSELNTPAIRAALLTATSDPVEKVASEAVRGLARKDRLLALQPVLRALEDDCISECVIEAAATVADPALIEALQQWAGPSKDPYFDQIVREAIAACERGEPAP